MNFVKKQYTTNILPYSKQQATMTDFESVLIPEKYLTVKKQKEDDVANAEIVAADVVSPDEEESSSSALEEMLSKVQVGTVVTHKKFGEGTIIWMDNVKIHIRVKFAIGEKQFIFPDAFISGFLALK